MQSNLQHVAGIVALTTTGVLGMIGMFAPLLVPCDSSILSTKATRKMIHKRRMARPREQSEAKVGKPHHHPGGENFLLAQEQNWNQSNTGIEREHFNYIQNCVRLSAQEEENNIGGKCRRRFLNVGGCVALTLQFLRHAPRPSELARIHGLSKTVVHRTIEWTLLHMRTSLDTIKTPQPKEVPPPLGRFNSNGSIDCCTHPRDRVHPGQDEYYRGDKMCHFLTSQVVVDHLGYIIRLSIGKGHNNDQGMFQLTNMLEWLQKSGLGHLLADGGYSGDGTVRPMGAQDLMLNGNNSALLASNAQHSGERVLVENINSFFKGWHFASAKCKLSVELQAVALMVCGQLACLTHKPNPTARSRILNANQH